MTPRSAREWPGPRLLVPMTLEALVLTSHSHDDPWSWASTQFEPMRFFGKLEPDAFNDLQPRDADGRPVTGVVLHWALPDGLTHGAAGPKRKDGTVPPVEFPLVPNRWFVARAALQKTGASFRRSTRAWIVESDHVGRGATVPFPDERPDDPTAWIRVGRHVDLDAWAGEPDAGRPLFLRAVGAGNPTFAAFAPNVRDVFAFADDLRDVEPATLSYLVAGWYSDPQADPLAQCTSEDEWAPLMQGLRWSVGDAAALAAARSAAREWSRRRGSESYSPGDWRAEVPAQTLPCGMIYDVKWEGANGLPQSGVPERLPRVAIGNTGIEALAALIEAELPDDAHSKDAALLLEAFQYNLLPTIDKPGGQLDLDLRLHAASFGGSPGGTVYRVVAAEENPGAPRPDVFNLPAPIAQALELLNLEQSVLDRKGRELRAAQSALFMAWWKLSQLDAEPRPSVDRTPVADDVRDARERVLDAARELDGARQRCDTLRSELTGELPSTLQLVADARESFEQMADPVVLVSGAGRGYKHGEDGRFSDDGRLFCRFSGQTVSGIRVDTPAGAVRIDAPNAAIAVPDNQRIPREIADLSVEWFLLDTNTAPILARQALEQAKKPAESPPSPPAIDALAAIIAKQQTLVWNADVQATIDRQSIVALSGLAGVPPSKVGVALYSPPWSPLYLDWQVTWYPSYASAQHALSSWTFDGVDLRWNGASPPPVDAAIPFIGRTLLTPQVTDVLQTRLRQFIQHLSPDDPDFGGNAHLLGEVAQAIDDWDILSQALSGLNDFLVMRQGYHHRSPRSDDKLPFGDMSHFMPLPDTDPAQFFPVRAGHFTIDAIQVVDDFGQVLNPQAWRGQTEGALQPIRARNLVTAKSDRRIQLAPRLMQPARVRFEWEPSPVCGWLLPNHLDHALSVYDVRGTLLGELMLSSRAPADDDPGARDRQFRALWSPAPGPVRDPERASPSYTSGTSSASVGAPPQIEDEHLLNFVLAILSRADSGAALDQLMRSVDATLWGTDPVSARTSAGPVSLLVGRPLAVARATIAIELDAPPVTNQAWSRSGAHDAGGLTELEVPVRLGNIALPDDGLIGWFVNGDYHRCSVVRGAAVDGDPDDYVVGGDLPLSLKGTSATLTMILDARGAVHAASGLLPMTSVQLPSALVDQVVANMAVTFRTGPLLSDPATIRMPVPATGRGTWSWVQRTGVTVWEEDPNIVPANGAARLATTPPVMRDGWLKLEGSQQ